MKATLDRFEGDVAVLTPEGGGRPLAVDRGLLPPGTAEGDILEGEGSRWRILADETARRAKRIEELAKRLFKK